MGGVGERSASLEARVNQESPRSALMAAPGASEAAVGRTGRTRGAPALARVVVAKLRTAQAAVGRNLTIVLILTATFAGIFTFLLISRSTGITTAPDLLLGLLALDLVLLLALGGVVAWRVAKLWAERRAGAAGARLHVRLVSMFAALAVAPAIVVVVLAAAFFGLEVQAWFSERVRTAVTESVAVAKAYLREHKQVIGADALAMANDLNRQWPRLYGNPPLFGRFVETQASLRALNEAIVFDESGRLFAELGFNLTLRLERPPAWALEQASNGELVILTSEADDRVRALVGLDTLPPAFLYVGRSVDPLVLGHLERANRAASIYEQMETRRYGIQTTFAMVFILVALMLLMAAVGIGMNYATRLARPISGLVTAAEQVRAGNMEVRVPELDDESEFGSLTRAFNRMTGQLSEQRRELIEANRQLDDRRRFTEAVLAGVSAGVIGLDGSGRINLPNRSASILLSTDLDREIGRPLAKAVPEMAALVALARRRPERLREAQITLARGDRRRTLLVRVTAELGSAGEALGFVVTFDDITVLLAAQRSAAWADVARRIAHEIKNPLTPIQLSAERLKRKYLGKIGSDRETFEQCTDTIVRQVSDIGRMVDEFSSFARMPAPVMREHDLNQLCRDAVFLQRTANSSIRYTLRLADDALRLRCDGGLISQALTNLLKNAAEAIEERPEGRGKKMPAPGEITLSAGRSGDNTVIEVVDNGRGLPEAELEQLAEPYVTTRAKGSGLGLAIVKKIMEDHAGDLLLESRAGGGACVRLVFGAAPSDAAALEDGTDDDVTAAGEAARDGA